MWREHLGKEPLDSSGESCFGIVGRQGRRLFFPYGFCSLGLLEAEPKSSLGRKAYVRGRRRARSICVSLGKGFSTWGMLYVIDVEAVISFGEEGLLDFAFGLFVKECV
jgi:hypothetical protein